MTVGAATVSLNNYYGNNGGNTYGITVAGTLTATGTQFTSVYPNGGTISGLTALSGGRIIANSSTSSTLFAWDTFNLNNNSVLNAGDLSNDTFQTTVYAPGTDVPLLAGPTFTANKTFQDVDILAGSLGSGTLTLGVMGSASNANAKLRWCSPPGTRSSRAADAARSPTTSASSSTTPKPSPWTPEQR